MNPMDFVGADVLAIDAAAIEGCGGAVIASANNVGDRALHVIAVELKSSNSNQTLLKRQN